MSANPETEPARPDPLAWWRLAAEKAVADGTAGTLPGRTGDSIRLAARRITEGSALWPGPRC